MKVKFIILGCGSSLGVPKADGNWGNCNPRVKKIIEPYVLLLLNLNTIIFL